MNEIVKKLFHFLNKEDKDNLNLILSSLDMYRNSIDEGIIEVDDWKNEIARTDKLIDQIKNFMTIE